MLIIHVVQPFQPSFIYKKPIFLLSANELTTYTIYLGMCVRCPVNPPKSLIFQINSVAKSPFAGLQRAAPLYAHALAQRMRRRREASRTGESQGFEDHLQPPPTTHQSAACVRARGDRRPLHSWRRSRETWMVPFVKDYFLKRPRWAVACLRSRLCPLWSLLQQTGGLLRSPRHKTAQSLNEEKRSAVCWLDLPLSVT